MRTLAEDTSPAMEARQLEVLRAMPPWRKLELAGKLNAMVKQLAFRGLRRRYPHASEEELFRYFAEQRLGPDLAARVYGPLPELRAIDGE